MSTSQNLPDPTDKDALRGWMRERRAKAPGHEPVRSTAELAAAQHERLLRAIGSDAGADYVSAPRRCLQLTLDGPPVREHRIESAVLGRWLTALQDAVSAIAHALDDRRPTHDSGPVPKEIQRATRLYSAAVFPSSYGMVLEEAQPEAEAALPGLGPVETLLDKAVCAVLDITDRAGSGTGAEDAVIETALPFGSRAFNRLADLTGVLADSGADVRLTWRSPHSGTRISALGVESARRCREALRAARIEESETRLIGTVVGGSKARRTVEVETPDHRMITARVDQEVTGLLKAYAGREVAAQLLVATVRSPHGREHHSFVLLGLELTQD